MALIKNVNSVNNSITLSIPNTGLWKDSQSITFKKLIIK